MAGGVRYNLKEPGPENKRNLDFIEKMPTGEFLAEKAGIVEKIEGGFGKKDAEFRVTASNAALIKLLERITNPEQGKKKLTR